VANNLFPRPAALTAKPELVAAANIPQRSVAITPAESPWKKSTA
jgi:hypothetical protein